MNTSLRHLVVSLCLVGFLPATSVLAKKDQSQMGQGGLQGQQGQYPHQSQGQMMNQGQMGQGQRQGQQGQNQQNQGQMMNQGQMGQGQQNQMGQGQQHGLGQQDQDRQQPKKKSKKHKKHGPPDHAPAWGYRNQQ